MGKLPEISDKIKKIPIRGGNMKRKLALLALSGALFLPVSSFAGSLCSVKPEAEAKKEPLPVKYQKLKRENEELKAKLGECCKEKREVKMTISQLQSQINQLEGEKAQLQAKLSSLPPKWQLEEQIRELENRLGR